MAIRITNSTFHTVGTVVSAPKGTEVEIAGGSFVNCGKIVDLRDPPSLLAYLGLSDETPLPLVREMLEFAAVNFLDKPSLQAKSESIGILGWLGASADVSSLVTSLMALGQSDMFQAALSLLPK